MLIELVSSWFRPRPPSRFHVREVRDWKELEGLYSVWTTLFQATPATNFFQTWGWFETYWQHFGEDQRLRILIVEEPDGSPVGLVPLTIRLDSSPFGRVRRLGFPLDNWGTQYGPLGARPQETLAAALKYLRDRRQEWDLLDLRWIPAEETHTYVSAWRSAGMCFQQKLWSRTARIDLSAGWRHYWNSRTSKWRNNQRRNDKLLAKLGALRIEHFRPAAGITDVRDDLFESCEQVAAASWQGASPSGNTLNHPSISAFLRAAHSVAARTGCLHLSLLYLDERPVAFAYNYVASGVVLGLRMGYDLKFQAAGPGAVLMRETIRDCGENGDHTFDLGESPTPFKRHFANSSFESFRFCHYSAASPAANALRIKSWLTKT